MKLAQVLHQQKVLPVIRAETADKGQRLLEALYQGGIRIIELTTTVPGVFDLVKRIHLAVPHLVVGVGTLHTGELAQKAADCGSDFLVTYKVSPEVASVGKASNVPYILGASTPTEVDACLRLGSDIVKIFPASVLGVDFIRELRGILPNLQCLPTGGITPSNAGEWLDHGALAVGMGSALTRGDQAMPLEARVRQLLSDLSVNVADIDALIQGGVQS